METSPQVTAAVQGPLLRVCVGGRWSMVQRGLRARLQLQSLITGQYRVELDFYPATPANFRSATPDTEIPTIPSPIDTLQSTLSQMPLEQMVNSLSAVLQNLALGLNDDKLGKALTAFTNTFEETYSLLHEGTLRNNSEQVLKNLSSASAAVEKELPATMGLLPRSFSAIGRNGVVFRQLEEGGLLRLRLGLALPGGADADAVETAKGSATERAILEAAGVFAA